MNEGAGGGGRAAGDAARTADRDAVTPAPGAPPPAPQSASQPSLFGRQRPPLEVIALGLLFTGFAALGVAFLILTASWAGLLLPLAFLLGVFPSLRAEVREIELRGDALLVRTFFREYPIPRTHIKAILRIPEGIAVEVLNGNRYLVTPPGTDLPTLASSLEQWLNREGEEAAGFERSAGVPPAGP